MTEKEFIESMNKPREIVIYCGRPTKYEFDTMMIIESCTTKDEIVKQYRISRDKAYNLQLELEQIKYNKIVKLLIYLKIIKV